MKYLIVLVVVCLQSTILLCSISIQAVICYEILVNSIGPRLYQSKILIFFGHTECRSSNNIVKLNVREKIYKSDMRTILTVLLLTL